MYLNWAIQKTAEATSNLVANKINKITKVSETFTNEEENVRLDRKIPKERNISPEKRQKIIDDQRWT